MPGFNDDESLQQALNDFIQSALQYGLRAVMIILLSCDEEIIMIDKTGQRLTDINPLSFIDKNLFVSYMSRFHESPLGYAEIIFDVKRTMQQLKDEIVVVSSFCV